MQTSLLLLIFSILTPINSLKFLPQSDPNYDQTIANTSWYFCGASYCQITNIAQWKVSPASELYPNVHSINVFTNSTGENLGFSSYDPDSNRIFIVFRGSDNVPNWLENLDTLMTGYRYCVGCQVHAGFNAAYNDIRDHVIARTKVLKREYPGSEIVVTGHSLGAAIATLAYVDLYNVFGKIEHLYTFGSPRVGNLEFAEYVNLRLNEGFKARITHYKDIITHFPFTFLQLQYRHVDREVFYSDELSTMFTVCEEGQEDPDCAERYKIGTWTAADHQNYMGFNKETMVC